MHGTANCRRSAARRNWQIKRACCIFTSAFSQSCVLVPSVHLAFVSAFRWSCTLVPSVLVILRVGAFSKSSVLVPSVNLACWCRQSLSSVACSSVLHTWTRSSWGKWARGLASLTTCCSNRPPDHTLAMLHSSRIAFQGAADPTKVSKKNYNAAMGVPTIWTYC